MELRNITTFLRVAELQNFSQAAENLGYSQSAVTVQIRQLENELGVRLFDRIGKNIVITQYGKEFMTYAGEVLAAAARAAAGPLKNCQLSLKDWGIMPLPPLRVRCPSRGWPTPPSAGR